MQGLEPETDLKYRKNQTTATVQFSHFAFPIGPLHSGKGQLLPKLPEKCSAPTRVIESLFPKFGTNHSQTYFLRLSYFVFPRRIFGNKVWKFFCQPLPPLSPSLSLSLKTVNQILKCTTMASGVKTIFFYFFSNKTFRNIFSFKVAYILPTPTNNKFHNFDMLLREWLRWWHTASYFC